MRIMALITGVVMAGSLATPALAASSGYDYTDMGTLGRTFTEALSVNNSGHAVGSGSTASGPTHAFYWQKGRPMKDLGTLGGTTSVAYSLNDKDQAVGYAFTAAQQPHAVRWQKDGTVTDLAPKIGGEASYAYDINEAGHIVGVRRSGSQYEAFLLKGNQLTILGVGTAYALNDIDSVVGTTGNGTFAAAFVWKNGNRKVLEQAAGQNIATAYDINNKGEITGFGGSGYRFWPVIWRDGKVHILKTFSPSSAFAYSINESGTVVGGGITEPTGEYRAARWSGSDSTDDIGFVGYNYSEARGISDNGYIAVNRTTNNATVRQAILATPKQQANTDDSNTININSTISVSGKGNSVTFGVTAF